MSDIALKIKVSGNEQVEQMGEYIAVKTANVVIDVHVPGVGTMVMRSGDVWRISGGFNGFLVENYGLVDADILLAVGDGDYRPGLVVGSIDTINSIVNPVQVQKHAVSTIDSIINALPVRPFPSFYTMYQGVAFSVTCITPAQNVNGVIIGNVINNIGSTATATLYAAASMPANPYDNINRVLSRVTGTWSPSPIASPFIFVQAGMGVYYIATGAGMISFDYEVL